MLIKIMQTVSQLYDIQKLNPIDIGKYFTKNETEFHDKLESKNSLKLNLRQSDV